LIPEKGRLADTGLIIIFTVASIVRSYCVRRWFNAALHRAVLRVTGGMA
jgi:hypothetical protein